MGSLIFDVLCEIAHYKSNRQTSNAFLQFQLVIVVLQLLGLLFPNDGWKLWKYQDDPVLNYVQQALNCFLVLPIQHNQKTLDQLFTCFFFALQCLVILILVILGFNKKLFLHGRITDRIHSLFVSLINIYFLNITQLISIPFELFYLNFIFCSKYPENQNQGCSLQPFFYIGVLGIVFTVISQFISIYLFRSYSFKPFSVLQHKYSINQFIIISLRPIVEALYLLQTTEFNNYILLIAYNCLLLSLLFEYYYQHSYYPPNNQFKFQLISSIFPISLLITVNVLSTNTIVEQDMILLSAMIAGSAGYHFSHLLWERKLYAKSHSELLDQYRSIDLVQRLYEAISQLKQSKRQRIFFHYYILLINYSDDDVLQLEKYNFQTFSSRKHIILFLQNQLKLSKAHGKMSFEQVQLVYIDYLSNYCKKPLLGLVEFRKYDIFYSQQQTFYFGLMKRLINENLEKMVQKLQQRNTNQLHTREQEKQSLDIIHISKSIVFEELYIPNIIKLMDCKILFWELLIKGYNTIYEFQNEAINLSKKVQILQRQLLSNLSFDVENIDHLGTNCNVLELKIASIFYSSVMNDYYNSAQCEFLIQEIFNIEHTLSSDIITNFTLVEDKVALIMISLVRNLGQIINQDKRSLSQYFGYDEKEFQSIQFINQLMPNYISVIHNNLLSEYLQKAKSKLFFSYNLVFSCDKLGYLIPQQLKIDNNFFIQDDYVIMGCLSQIKKGVDFILFCDNGKLWGCTQSFFENYIRNYNEKVSLQRFINQCYIYMLIPSIVKIIDSYKQQLVDILNETTLIEETASLLIRQNLSELLTQFQQQSVTVPTKGSNQHDKSVLKQKKINTQDSIYRKIDYKQSEMLEIQKQLSLAQVEEQNDQNNESDESTDQNQYLDIPLLNKQYQQEILSFTSISDEKQIEKYFTKFTLCYKCIGKDNFKRSYFILEFQDIRKKDLIGKSVSTNPQMNTNESRFQSMQNNQNQTTINESNLNISGFTQTEQPFSEIVPVTKDIGCGVTELLERLGHPKRNKHDQDLTGLLNLDSGRDSLSYGPLSQRAHFITPNQKGEELEEIGKIDQDFNEIGQNFNSASAVLQNQQQQQFDAIDDFGMDASINEQQQQQQQQGKSSSNKEKDKEILNVIQMNKLKGKNHEEEEVEALKSKSSITSGTSGNSAIQLIKKFQSLTHLTQSLKLITLISLCIFIILIILISVHLVIITSSNEETNLAINDINGPFILNRTYLEVISFTWSLIVSSMKIIDFSDFVSLQTMSDLTNTTDTLYDEINSMYLGFIQVEEKGLLSEQQYTFLTGTKESMKFPYFINIIEETLDRVVKITKYNISDISLVFTQEYMNELLLLRYNLNQIYTMSSELIDSLNIIFLNSTSDKVAQMQTQVIVEVICVAFILLIELYFWRQIQSYCQQLMLLTGRLQESDANELIARATLVKETLAQKSGKFSWKKQNYYSINYQHLSQLNFEMLNTQSRILKDLIQKNHLDYTSSNKKNDYQQQNKQNLSASRRNLNVVLSSRIYNTQISIIQYIIMLISIFIILALLFFGGFLLFSSQSNDLGPSQTLTANYIKFTSKLDTLMACAQIIKTQPLLEQKMIELGIYNNNTVESLYQTNDIVVLFSKLSKIYSENLTSIYQDIIQSNKISQSDKNALYTLYEDDFCHELSDEIPMCNYEQFGLEKFTQSFGQPNVVVDDNTEFVNKGIVGVVSRLDTLFAQIFDYEIEFQQFQPDLSLTLEQINSKEFRNAVFAHFLDTNDGTNTFLDIIQISTYGILSNNLYFTYLYYGIVGFVLVLCYAIFYVILIIRTNNKLIRIRLALITLPISILTEQHTISMLKRLN